MIHCQLKYLIILADLVSVKVEWFVYINSNVQGPYSTEQLRSRLDQGLVKEDAFVWWKGQQEWMPVRSWESYIDDNYIGQPDVENKKIWNIRIHDKTLSNLSFNELLEKLKTIQNYTHVSVRQNESSEWENIYARQEILTELGMSRRKFLRAPLMGSAKVVKDGSRFSYIVKTATLGQGGMGLIGQGTNLSVNSTVNIKVESTDLSAPLNLSGTVLYMLKSGFIGVKFANANAESQTIIMDYLRKFEGKTEPSEGSAA